MAARSTISNMQADVPPFDLFDLSRSIDQTRAERELTLAALSRHVGVSTSTIRRFRTATDAEADGVLAMVGWLGVPPERFVRGSTVDGTLLPPAQDGLIRVDMSLVAEVTGRRPAQVVSRTSIQQLVIAAQASGRAVASFTRWSPF